MQLSRSLASRGHEVLHLHFADFPTPKGPITWQANDPSTLTIEGLTTGGHIQTRHLIRRFVEERRYGPALARRIVEYAPDVVISANTPLDAQEAARAAARRANARFVYWIQDLYSVAVSNILRRKAGVIGGLAAARFTRLERRILQDSDAVVAITEDFVPILAQWGVGADRIMVNHNWAPLNGVRPMSRNNDWARLHGLLGKRVLLYSGTLGLKHNPAVFLALAGELAHLHDVRVVVVSEGLGADWLRKRAQAYPNLILLPFQRYEQMSEVLGSADILVAILEPDAGVFSVPSKVLSYLAAGRPILAAIPSENLAARIVERQDAGVIVEPGNLDGLVSAAIRLLADTPMLLRCGENARAYAAANFDITEITNRFEVVLGVA